jgi:hypothetical protein
MVVDDVGKGLLRVVGVALRLVGASELHQDGVLGQVRILLRRQLLPCGNGSVGLA